jgi:hypothetical protein
MVGVVVIIVAAAPVTRHIVHFAVLLSLSSFASDM